MSTSKKKLDLRNSAESSVKLMDRRFFLRGSGGGLFAIPFLPSLLKSEKALGNPEDAVKWFVNFQSGNGYMSNRYAPAHALWNNAVTVAPNIRAMPLTSIAGDVGMSIVDLNPYKADLLLCHGLTLGNKNHDHTNGLQTLQGVAGTNFLGVDYRPPGYDKSSLDVLIARKIAHPANLYNLVTFGASGGNYSLGGVNKGAQMPILSTQSLSYLWQQLFGGLSGDQGLDLRIKQGQVFSYDQLKNSYDRIKNKLSGNDVQTMNQHLETLNQIQNQIQNSMNLGECVKPGNPGNISMNAIPQAIQILGNLVATAIKCDIVRSFTLDTAYMDSTTNIFFGWGYHGVSHIGNTGTPEGIAESANKLENIHKEVAKGIANFFGQMKNAVDPRSGVPYSDNGGVWWTNDLGSINRDPAVFNDVPYDTHTHRSQCMLALTLGKFCGKMRTNAFVDFNNYTIAKDFYGYYRGRAFNNYQMTLLKAFGVTEAEIETDGLVGFGDYRFESFTGSPAQFGITDDASKRATLPYIFLG